jgi:hypothetical protein
LTTVQPATSGRLGNQLFHAAYAFDLAARLDCGVSYDRRPADVEMMLVLNPDGSVDEIPTGDLDGVVQIEGIDIRPSPGAERVRSLLCSDVVDPRVAIHVRRTDFLRPGCCFEALPADYYQRAAWEFADSRFAVFSDDLTWCRENLLLPGEVDFMDIQDPAEALRALSACEHHIISNSTFSWWAAWIADSRPGHRVVAPSVWYRGADSRKHLPGHWRTA